MDDPLRPLFIADPEAARKVEATLGQRPAPPDNSAIDMLCEETIWGLSLENSFGLALADAYLSLIGKIPRDRLMVYKNLVREAAQTGPTVAKLYAVSLGAVFLHGTEDLPERFLAVTRIMLAKGAYTLPQPLDVFGFLLSAGEREAADSFLDLLEITFRQDLSYNQSKQLANSLPPAIRYFTPERRVSHTLQLIRVMREDADSVEPFLESLRKGLGLLDHKALDRFVTTGLEKLKSNRTSGRKFLSLASYSGIESMQAMQVAVSMSEITGQLNRYLQARTGLSILVKPLSALSTEQVGSAQPVVTSDGANIYLPDEINMHMTRQENRKRYKLLAALEAAYFERKTFDFDVEKAMAYSGCGELHSAKGEMERDSSNKRPDLEMFYDLFPEPLLSRDLFTIFEHGRLWLWLERAYPGLTRQLHPLLCCDMDSTRLPGDAAGLLNVLYKRIALGLPQASCPVLEPLEEDFIKRTSILFFEAVHAESPVEVCAPLAWKSYQELCRMRLLGKAGRLRVPFNRSLRPDLFYAANGRYESLSGRVKEMLRAQGVHVYRSDIVNMLRRNTGRLSKEDIQAIVRRARRFNRRMGAGLRTAVDPAEVNIEELNGGNEYLTAVQEEGGLLFRYPEWDSRLGDYLQDYVMVRERSFDGPDSEIFGKVLARHRGLVKRIRTSFELLKPQGLKILRNWLEGDDFDYRALLDFAIDKRAGIMPSDRLYLKRLKQKRDVSVLILVDLSRSTANPVAGTQNSVLDLEKEAIVLLCEALETVGDAYSIAGFSGTGRLGVDYYPIKRFNEPLSDPVRRRIGAMSPQRSTRMGAAVRHGTFRLAQEPSKVRLMLILGDGFPNDTGYKQEYALEDTRRAIREARGRNIFAHSITVNISADKNLDKLYGKLHHNVISDVKELPDRMLRIYSALTR